MARFYDQFVAFGVDNGGLEKLLRLIQSGLMILTSYPLLLTYLLPAGTPLSAQVSAEMLLVDVQGHLNIVRRWMRAFRFLEALGAGWAIYTSPTPPATSYKGDKTQGKGFDAWLDALALTCFGLFGMVESVTLLDVAPVDGLTVFGEETTVWMNLEAHKFWFAGLYASAVSAGFKLFRVMALQAVPATGQGFAGAPAAAATTTSSEDEKKQVGKSAEELRKTEAARRKEERRRWAAEVSAKTGELSLSLLASVLDLPIPAATLGWVTLSDGLVGSAMFCSSVIMVMGVWKDIGVELDKRGS